MGDQSSFTELLQRHRGGEEVAIDALLPSVYDELRLMAKSQLQRESVQPLEPTALVHEVYLRMVDQTVAAIEDRTHFRGLCARVMRQVLVDHARKRNAQKRDANREETLATSFAATDASSVALPILDLDAALKRLAALDVRKAKVVELRCFGGLSMAEVAAALEVSLRTVEADWFFARAWLKSELQK